VSKKRGAVLFTASVVAYVSLPLMSVYGATKAYLGIFGENVATEATGIKK
jgi:short-subunit dehydrogenase